MAKILRVKGSTAPVKAEVTAGPKKVKAAKKDTPSKYLGRTTGMRVMAYQDKLMRENYKAKHTDETLAESMRAEFPMAAKFTVAHVKGIRSQFNHGKRASQDGQPPAKPLTEFDDAGNAIVRGPGKAPVPKGKGKFSAEKPVKVKGRKKAEPVEDEEEEEDEDV
jgi:hypothetical protein